MLLTKSNKYLVIISFFLLCISNASAQRIDVNASGFDGKAAIFYLEGEKSVFLDSVNVDNGKISLQAAKYNLHIGFYRVTISDNKWIDFIYDNENIKIETVQIIF